MRCRNLTEQLLGNDWSSHTTAEIAKICGSTPNSVKTTIRHIFEKNGTVIACTDYIPRNKDDPLFLEEMRERNRCRAAAKRKGKYDPCAGCIYRRKIVEWASVSDMICYYLLDEGHMRGCPPGENCIRYTSEAVADRL